jgi:radial spoke head protein 4A
MATSIPRDDTTMASLEQEVLAAKAFLLKSNKASAQNLYDHLSECLSKILDERPNDIIDTFEQVSLKIKAEKFLGATNTVQDAPEPSPKVDISEKRRPLFEVSASEKEEEIDEEVGVPYPNLLESMNYFAQGGIGLGLEEVFQISLALKKLTQKHPLASVRFWGKLCSNTQAVVDGTNMHTYVCAP